MHLGCHELINTAAVIVFLDLEKAFELASPAAILSSLVSKGVEGHLLKLIKGYSLHHRDRAKFQGLTSDYKELENELPREVSSAHSLSTYV